MQGNAAYELKYYYGSILPLSIIGDKLLATLIKLRTHPTNFELSLLFCTSEKLINNIVITWIYFMNVQWNEIPCWPSEEMVQYYVPNDLRSKLPKTSLIFNFTEIPIQKLLQSIAQEANFLLIQIGTLNKS